MKSLRIKLILLLLPFAGLVTGQHYRMESPTSVETDLGIHSTIQRHTDSIFENLVAIRRDFHQYPEVSEEEERTARKVAEYLKALGLDVTSDIGGYGVVGILKGAKEGKRIAWRADMDAIATEIPDVVDFPSKNKGVRHICGHDVHTTIGLGMADVLAHMKKDLSGTVYFIFQPAEEKFEGANLMIADGLFQMIQPDEIYGLHMSPYPVGTIATKAENVFAVFANIEVSYTSDQNQQEIINFTKEVMSNNQTFGPDAKFWDMNNLFSPELGVTHPNTIYKDYVALMSDFTVAPSNDGLKIKVLVDASEKEQLHAYLGLITEKIQSSAYAGDLQSVKYDFMEGMPIIETPMNDATLAKETMQSISEIYGNQSVIPLYGVGPLQFSDDFAYFQKSVPGVYFFLGGSNIQKGIMAMPHTPEFQVDETCIKTGVTYFSSMILERLNASERF